MSHYYQEYCAGCGLCQDLGLTTLEYEKDGFPYPKSCDKKMTRFCDAICPMGKEALNKRHFKNLWGDYKEYYTGYSNNPEIRHKASSGGILTEICIALLEKDLVDGIIQISVEDDHPTETKTVISRTAEEVVNCSGSRYAVSMPLCNIVEMMIPGEKYAFVGKPCDVVALRNYATINSEFGRNILYYFSFFCAGTPSRNANDNMLEALGCPKVECVSFSYRGNGWPGEVTAVRKNGKQYKMDYYTAWMNILGRIIKRSCKFCVDSIGEASDISCGDHWYLGDDKKPVFNNRDGRNCIFAWNETGKKLLRDLQQEQRITLNNAKIEELKYVQPNHSNRRSTILYKWFAMKLLFRKTPSYSLAKMLDLAKNTSIRQGYRIFKGTVKRILVGKI